MRSNLYLLTQAIAVQGSFLRTAGVLSNCSFGAAIQTGSQDHTMHSRISSLRGLVEGSIFFLSSRVLFHQLMVMSQTIRCQPNIYRLCRLFKIHQLWFTVRAFQPKILFPIEMRSKKCTWLATSAWWGGRWLTSANPFKMKALPLGIGKFLGGVWFVFVWGSTFYLVRS